MQPVLSDAGPLIALGKLNHLWILARLYPKLCVPSAVHREVVLEGSIRGFPDAVTIRLFLEHYSISVVEASTAVLLSYTPSLELDPGERELLALAGKQTDALVLLDDEAARAEARRLGLSVRGTLGTLVQAYRRGLIDLDLLELLILEIAARPDIWISEKLCQEVLAQLLA